MPKKIMVVDDDPNIVDYLVNIFEDNGYATCSASDGSKALGVMKEEKPDLVTLDLEMPQEWGPRFYRAYTKDPELKETPVIIISGLSSIDYAIRKAAAAIKKPFDPEHVLSVVKRTLGD
jgi:DNA-binding NtrC family response regulator